MRKIKRIIILLIVISCVLIFKINKINAATLDNNPPKLISFSLDTKEATPGEYFYLNIEAEDDLSGLGRGSIGLYSEAKGYAVYQIDIDDLNNPKIMIPEKAIGGEYLISHLMIEDKNDNMITYYNSEIEKYSSDPNENQFDFSEYHITIVSESGFDDDKEAPVVKEATVNKKEIALGEEITVCAKVEDKSEISFVDINIGVKGTYEENISKMVKEETEPGLYCAKMTPQKTGTYELKYIAVNDIYDNGTNYFTKEYYSDRTNVIDGFEIIVNGPESDRISPVLKSITINRQSLVAPGTVKVFIDAEDNSKEELKEVSLRFISEDYYNKNEKNGTYSDGELGIYLFYDKVIDKYVGTLELNQYAVAGKYYLQTIVLTDKYQNSSQYVSKHYPDGFSGGYTGTLRKREVIDDLSFEVKEEFPCDIVTSTIKSDMIETIKNQKDDAVIMLDATNEKIIPASVFEAIKGTNKTIYIESNGYQWVFNGKDITEPKDIDSKIYSELLKDEDIDNESQDFIAIVFPENGVLPGKAKIRVKTDYTFRYMEGYKDLVLFYYNNDADTYEQMNSEITLTEDGFYEFDITHNSKYVISSKNVGTKLLTSSRGTKDSINKALNFIKDNYLYFIIGFVGLIAVIIIIIVISKKRKKNNIIANDNVIKQ